MRRYFLLALILFSTITNAQKYTYIKGWPKETNQKIEAFLNSTKKNQERKVAVFDGDGTVFGQVPHYLADEALYMYADKNFKGKTDKNSLEKLSILERMVKNGDNVSKEYVEDRVHFLSGMTPDEIRKIGSDCFKESYQSKVYPEMKQLINNLKEYNFEVWILTASPELLYQQFLAQELGIPELNILGVKAVVENNKITNQIILPIPQDDGKAYAIETFIQTKPLVVGGNSRGDLDMLNESAGLKIVVNPDDETIRPEGDGIIAGYTVKTYWENHDGTIVYCKDSIDKKIKYHTQLWNIKQNKDTSKHK